MRATAGVTDLLATGEREARHVRSQQPRHDSERYAGMLTSKLAGMKVPEAGTERYRRAVDTLHCVIEGYLLIVEYLFLPEP